MTRQPTLLIVVALLGVTALAAQARADVTASSDAGFAVTENADVPGRQPYQVWRALLRPAKWWDKAHSWSGDASNLTLKNDIGGCFCEVWPVLPDGGVGLAAVEHARVIAAVPDKLLRLSGALGPLQSEAVTGTLSIALTPTKDGGTHMSWEYVVGGFMRLKVADIAPAVDRVIGEQAARLAAYAGSAKALRDNTNEGAGPPR